MVAQGFVAGGAVGCRVPKVAQGLGLEGGRAGEMSRCRWDGLMDGLVVVEWL